MTTSKKHHRRPTRYPKTAGVYLPHELYSSRAFDSLNGRDIKVLLMFYSKRQFLDKKTTKKCNIPKDFVVNKDDIRFPYREAEAYGVCRSQFRRAVIKLQEVGFIEVSIQAYERHCTVYSISTRWKNYADEPFEVVKSDNLLGKNYHFEPGNKLASKKNPTAKSDNANFDEMPPSNDNALSKVTTLKQGVSVDSPLIPLNLDKDLPT